MSASRRNLTTMRITCTVWVIAAICQLFTGVDRLAAQIIETRRVIGGGGGVTTGTTYIANGTIGQGATGQMVAQGGNLHDVGFWYGIYSPEVAHVQEEEMSPGASRIALWPNPASQRTTVEFVSAESGIGEIRIVDLLGNVAMRLPAEMIEAERPYHKEIDLAGIPSGSYMVVLATPRGTTMRPLVITH